MAPSRREGAQRQGCTNEGVAAIADLLPPHGRTAAMSERYDVAVIGAGVMGASAALFLARGGMKVLLLDRGELCREASGVNAGTLTLHMTRAALIPCAQAGWR